MLARLRSFTRMLLDRDRFERSMTEEMRFHMDAYADDLVRAGASPEDARRRARIAFGPAASHQEECREARGAGFLDQLRQDLRYAIRQLARSPGFAAAAVLSLALGIGANTAIFGLMDAVLFRSVPVTRPAELFFLGHGEGDDRTTASNYPLLERYRSAGLFDGVTAYARRTFTVSTPEGLERVEGQHASGNYHAVLGVRMGLGRGFADEPDRPDGRAPIAVISDGYWTRRFGRDSSVLGRTLSVGGRSITIVGVTAPDFHGLIAGNRVDITLPLSLRALDNPAFLTDRESWISLRLVGRLKPGASQAATEAQVRDLFRLYWAEPENQRPKGDVRHGALIPAGRGTDDLRDRYATPLRLLLGMVAIVLLIACANVANLAFARATARAREVAVRLSLGASRARLVRQMLTESLVVSLAGGALGVFVAAVTTRLIVSSFRTGESPIAIDAAVSGRVLAFTGAVAVITCLLVGLAPAVRATRVDVVTALKGVGRGGRGSVGRVLVVAQLALSVVVVGVAALLARSVHNLRTFDAGFSRDRIVLVNADAASRALTAEERAAFFSDLRARLRTLPGVTAVASAQRSPVDHSVQTRPIEIPGVSSERRRGISANVVTPEFFRVFGIRVVRGRSLSEADRAGTPPVAVIDETAARTLFNAVDPIGRTVLLGAEKAPYTIVGIVGSSRHEDLRDEPPSTIYTAVAQPPMVDGKTADYRWFTVAVQMPSATEAIGPLIRREAAALSREVTVSYVRTLEQQLDAALLRERLLAGLSTGYASLALVLSLIGLYGIASYGVVRRTREIGVRMALGASQARVLGGILRETLATSTVGIVLGMIGAIAATRLVASFLFGVSPRDPWTLGAVAALLVATGLMAGYLPARRAASIEPVQALKAD
jgi:predicted permease